MGSRDGKTGILPTTDEDIRGKKPGRMPRVEGFEPKDRWWIRYGID